MSSITEGSGVLEDVKIPVKLKLSAAWAALMFLYAYGDIFAYFRPGFIEDVMAGEVFAFEIQPAVPYSPSRSTSHFRR